jgi:ribonucleoside-diphosphate reductase beta chain
MPDMGGGSGRTAEAPAAVADLRRIRVEDKRIINASTDVNQLVPFKYKWAWDKYLSGCANHWMLQEINMTRDIGQWKDPNGLTEDERRVVKRNLGFFVTADSLAANNIVLGTYRHITAPECRQYLLRQAFEEAIHTHAYQYIVESLGLDEGEVFNAYHEIPSIRAKDEFLIPFIDTLTDPSFRTGTPEADQKLLKSLIVFACLMEGLFFYVGLCPDSGTGAAEQDDRRRGAVPVHPARRVDALQFRHRPDQPDQAGKPGAVDDRVPRPNSRLFQIGVELEYRYAEDTMPRGVLGLNADRCSRAICAS